MPYPPHHRLETRARIVASAVRQFGDHGFDHVSIDEVMEGAGLTRGGFYKYFSTKGELFAEAILAGVTADPDPDELKRAGIDFEMLVASYVGDEHVTRSDGCPLTRFPESAARGEPDLRDAYTTVAWSIADTFAASLRDTVRSDEVPLATLAMCVGAIVIARGTDDPELAQAIRFASRSAAETLARSSTRAEDPTSPLRAHQTS